MRFDSQSHAIIGSSGRLTIPNSDDVTRKLCMLIEGECEGLGPTHSADKYGYSRQRYTQLRAALAEGGSAADEQNDWPQEQLPTHR
jgi:hypothetical protein